jgi:hypothetical protein
LAFGEVLEYPLGMMLLKLRKTGVGGCLSPDMYIYYDCFNVDEPRAGAKVDALSTRHPVDIANDF